MKAPRLRLDPVDGEVAFRARDGVALGHSLPMQQPTALEARPPAVLVREIAAERAEAAAVGADDHLPHAGQALVGDRQFLVTRDDARGVDGDCRITQLPMQVDAGDNGL